MLDQSTADAIIKVGPKETVDVSFYTRSLAGKLQYSWIGTAVDAVKVLLQNNRSNA